MDLHPHEIKVLKGLDREYSPEELAGKLGLEVDTILRASAWLKTKGLIEVSETIKEVVTLGEEGKIYAEKLLPERRILQKIGDGCSVDELKKKFDVNTFNIGFGWLRRKNLIEIYKGIIRPRELSKTEGDDERLIRTLPEKGGIRLDELGDKDKKAVELLNSRQNVVKISESKLIRFKPNIEGLKLAKTVKEDDRISQLTPELIKTGAWKKTELRPYDVNVFVKPEYPARKHPLQRQIRNVRRIFLEMGFREIKGPMVESAFWNFDALFQPQDHPARDMHDTFYLKTPGKIEVDGFERFKENVGKTHEDGWTTGSTGWGYKWNPEVALKTLLRTHTTAVTARELSKVRKEDLPVKVFCIGKVFRNEAVDYKHLPEFYQVEVIVVDDSVNFRNLLGILKQFYDQMGFSKIRFRPGYFPYTEMSVEPEVYFEDRKEWIELGGAGIFRPEVVKPLLGIDVPVLAWGLGLDRVVALNSGLKDIRELYISDLEWLRK
ncbi:MAG: phenylalanine--tRNA ligase subunit alpha [Candidatus Altiarchaeota archaeon]|nr:phenylalanine--tRNA ligase subunit alpha [Candidatus Altiarchaeota archaeon]